ncbi:hypothetical protein LCGC14_1316490 [marine sediment metagenome]|uniref:Uncharacterized protein n=1 Tax=marine sediment metagenome TaxID=412755 RepID=A0A0F9L652_9ZZZZ
MIRQINITATVATGTTASATSEFFSGKILKIDMNVTGNSMDINLDTVGEQKTQAIFDYTGNTDTTFYPRVALTDNTGSALDLSDAQGGDVAMYGEFVVFGKVTLSLASAAVAETVTVGITFED